MTEPTLEQLEARARRLLGPGGFDRQAALTTADALERHERWRLAWPLWRRAGLANKARSPLRDLEEWDGRLPVAGRVVVTRRLRHVGSELRLARLLPRVVENGGRCLAYLEPRFAPLARRSYPDVQIRSLDDLTAFEPGPFASDDRAAGLEDLGAVFLPDDAAVAASFRPLSPDPARVDQARAHLEPTPGAAFGISWASDNPGKHPPLLEHWRTVFEALPGPFLSLQYGPLDQDLARFQSLTDRFRHDPRIDPLLDLEGHAAQIAVVSAVITISNTAAHMAGALGKPTVVLLDDEQAGIWPLEGDRSAWYPSVRLVRRRRRPWPEVMAEAAALASALAAKKGHKIEREG